jgi:DNA-binding MarR family transcriptional regulator
LAQSGRDGKVDLVPLIVADIYQLAGQLRKNADAIAGRIGQTQARWQVLSAASADPKTVPQIARRLGIARQNVQRVADLLIAEGLARLAPNPDHKTSPFLVLTPTGAAAFARLASNGRAYYAALADGLSAADLISLRRGLRRFCDVLDRREDFETNNRGGL